MADVVREMERLRPVYEAGVLRSLRRANSMLYVALLRAAFDPLTDEMPRETLEERFARALERLESRGMFTPHEGEDARGAAARIVGELSREGEGDYAWLANAHDPASHRFLYRLTARAHRAVDALARLEDESRVLSGAQANSIVMEVEHARMRLTADPEERVRLLNREIKARKREIRRIRGGEGDAALSDEQVGDAIAVVRNTLRGVGVDLRELVLAERDNGDMLRRRMQAADMDVDEILSAYHDDYRRAFLESDGGRRFEDAFQVIVTDEGRRQIDDALRAIARTPYLADAAREPLEQVREELSRIYEGIEAVLDQIRVSDEAVSRLVRQRTDTRYRTMLGRLNRLFAAVNRDARDHPNDPSRPYGTDTATVRIPVLPTRPARPMTRSTPPGLSERPASAPPADLGALVEGGGPRLRRILALIAADPVVTGEGRVDVAASFNRLPARERRESELVGFLGALRDARPAPIGRHAERDGTDADGMRERMGSAASPESGASCFGALADGASAYPNVSVWRCTSIDGRPRIWLTGPVTASRDELDDIIREG